MTIVVRQSHFSQLEALKTSPTLEVNHELAKARNLNRVTILTLVQSAGEEKSPNLANGASRTGWLALLKSKYSR
ncbi:hypothetical protein I4N56_019620 [Pseudomonas mohnii]|nr:hypothetical protein [Pseudomonas mohnii]